MKKLFTMMFSAFAMMSSISGANVKNPDIKGTVLTPEGEPMSFVNVVLLNADSTFVQGATSDETGKFNIETTVNEGILKISSIGYKTLYIKMSDYSGEIKMQEDSQMLEEVTVKAQLPKTRLTGNSMVTSIQGSVLEKSGTAKEMLAKVPGMMQKGDDLEVLGKGTPVFYINGRKVTDMDELKRLRSEEIKDVEVITNPGALYDATVSAVVRIKTIRRQGTGFGYDLDISENSDFVYGYNDPSATLSLRYRLKNFDVFGMVNYWKWDGIQDSDPDQQSFLRDKNGELKTIQQDMHFRHDTQSQGMDYNLGFNWQLAENHSMGMRFETRDLLKTEMPMTAHTDVRQWIVGKENEVLKEESSSTQYGRHTAPYDVQGNAYYNGTVGKLGIDLNLDFVTYKTLDTEDIEEVNNGVLTKMNSDNHNKSYMVADKLVLSYPIWKGQLQAGTEMSYVRRKAQYQINNISLPATQSEVKERNIAAFAEYAVAIPKAGYFSASLRYEHVGFDYEDMLHADKAISRYDDDFFPSFSWSNQWGAVQTSLNYSFKTMRPDFKMLDESIMYINSYSLQQGNPTLKNEKNQQIGLNVHWKYLNLYTSYNRIDDGINNWSYLYDSGNPDDGMQGVILIKTINLKDPISVKSAFLSANPTFGCYSPNWTVGFQQYKMNNTLADPREATGQREVKYHRPMFIMDLNNAFRLKHSWQLEANLNAVTHGDYMNMRITSDTWNLGFTVQKCWLKNDALCLRASLYDALNKTATTVKMDCGYYMLNQKSINNRQRVNVSLRYTFNAQQSKYKGTGAGKETAGRMSK